MKKLLSGVCAVVAGFLMMSVVGIAGPMDNKVIVKGAVHIEKDAQGGIVSIVITPKTGNAVQVVLDKTGQQIAQINGYGVFARGTLDSNGALIVSTWVMDREFDPNPGK